MVSNNERVGLMTPDEIEARTAARMKWLKEHLSPEEWAQVVGCPDDPDGQHHSACDCDGIDPINPNTLEHNERLEEERLEEAASNWLRRAEHECTCTGISHVNWCPRWVLPL